MITYILIYIKVKKKLLRKDLNFFSKKENFIKVQMMSQNKKNTSKIIISS